MINKVFIRHITGFFLYTLLQVWFLNKLVLFETAFCYFYVGFLLFIPYSLSRTWQLGIGFLCGMMVDLFGNTAGLHASGGVTLMFLRPFWLSFTTGDKLDEGAEINLRNLGLATMIIYISPLILIHHGVIFYIEALGFEKFYLTLLRVVGSTFFTFAVIMTIQLFRSPVKRLI